MSYMLVVNIQFILEQRVSGHFRELKSGAVTDTYHIQIPPPSHLLSALFSLVSTRFTWTDILFELTANIHPRSMRTTCILIFRSL